MTNLTNEQLIAAIKRTLAKAKHRADPEIGLPPERQLNEIIFDLEHILDGSVSEGRKTV